MTDPHDQTLANCLAWWRHHAGIEPMPEVVDLDRVWFGRCPTIMAAIDGLVARGVICRAYAKNHGSTVESGYRERRTKSAAQIIVHTDAVEMDFDHWRPWDVVGFIGHAAEVLINKIGRRKTNPRRVARELRGRGIDV